MNRDGTDTRVARARVETVGARADGRREGEGARARGRIDRREPCRANDDFGPPLICASDSNRARISPVKHRLATTTDRFNPRATQNAMRAPALLSSTLAMGVSASRRVPSSARGRVVSSSAGRSTAVGPSADAASYRVFAFEDSYDIGAMLRDAKVRHGDFQQNWTSENAVDALEAFGRVDVLLLDFYLPPVTGLRVLQEVNEAVLAGRIERPRHVVGMSSVGSCNAKLIAEGADAGFVKWDVGTWEGWARDEW